MDFDQNKVDDYTLALMYLVFHGSKQGTRAWKGFDWDTLDRLWEKGFITDPKGKARSVIMTEEGKGKSIELFQKFFAK